MLKNDHEGQVHKNCRRWPRHAWRFYLAFTWTHLPISQPM